MYFLSSLNILSLCHNLFTINIIKAIPTSFFETIFCAYVILLQDCPLAPLWTLHSPITSIWNLCFTESFSKTLLKCLGGFGRKLSSVSRLYVKYLQHIWREILINSYFPGVFCFLIYLTVRRKIFSSTVHWLSLITFPKPWIQPFIHIWHFRDKQ